jgi:hypothetical protein
MTQKTFVDLIEILLAKKRIWNVVAVTGKIEYVPPETENERKNCKIVHETLCFRLE